MVKSRGACLSGVSDKVVLRPVLLRRRRLLLLVVEVQGKPPTWLDVRVRLWIRGRRRVGR